MAGFKLKSTASDSAISVPFADRSKKIMAQGINGIVLNSEIDMTHPVAYGYRSSTIPVFKDSKYIFEPSGNLLYNPLSYTSKPLVSGYASEANQKLLKGAPAIHLFKYGRGCIVSMADNPNFRSFWYGTNRLLINSVFFSNIFFDE
jgi:hypothetical protein